MSNTSKAAPSAPIVIREAIEADAASLLAIYRPFVEASAVSFETVVPSEAEFAARIAKARAGWQWLAAEKEGRFVGYACASPHRERPAAVGRKFGRWHDVAWFQRALRDTPPAQ